MEREGGFGHWAKASLLSYYSWFWTLNNSQTLLENFLMKSIEWMLMVLYYLLTQAEQKPDFTGVLLIPCLLLTQAEQRPDFTGIY